MGTAPDERLTQLLDKLKPQQVTEVIDFIEFLIVKTEKDETPKPGTLGDMLTSGLIGLWKDRSDIGDSIEFAHRLREEAEHRYDTTN